MMNIKSYMERKENFRQKLNKQIDINSELIKQIPTNKAKNRSN